MKASWVAGGVRAIAMSKRTMGRARIRALADSNDWADALRRLDGSPYAHAVHPGQQLAAAQRAVLVSLLWNLRVLAGWVPASGLPMLRIIAGWFEIANIESRLRTVPTDNGAQPFELGSLATSWRRLADAATEPEMRESLATTPWQAASRTSERDTVLTLRSTLLDRAMSGVPAAQAWILGAAVLFVADEQIVTGRSLPPKSRAAIARVIGAKAADARTLQALSEQISHHAQWVLADVKGPEQLWLAEGRWWARVEHEGFLLLRNANLGPETVLGACAVMAADAWRVRAALEVAARGGRGRQDFDALA